MWLLGVADEWGCWVWNVVVGCGMWLLGVAVLHRVSSSFSHCIPQRFSTPVPLSPVVICMMVFSRVLLQEGF